MKTIPIENVTILVNLNNSNVWIYIKTNIFSQWLKRLKGILVISKLH